MPSLESSEADFYRQAAIRAEAIDDLYFFSRYMFKSRKGFKWRHNWHHQVICDALMDVYHGRCPRLIINVPPRYSKTELAVINFMGWSLGNCPDAEFIHTSYSGRLAAGNSWQTRELVQHDAYRRVFPDLELRTDSQARDDWKTTKDGCVYAVGAGGTITGYGAGKDREGFGGAIIVDDPHKADEARSDVVRKGVIDWFQNTLESRKNARNTPIIVIMQRLHEADLSGWLLDGGNGEEWKHLVLPAIQLDDTALWEHKHTRADLERMQEAAPYTFAGQYQQSPAPPAGNIFKPDKIEIIDEIPTGTRMARGWDFGATEGGGDWTVGAKLGVTPSGRFIICDEERIQRGPEGVMSALKNCADADGKAVKISIPQDPGQAGKFQAMQMVKALTGYSVIATPESGDKITRAEPFAAQVNVGNVAMVKAPWNEALKTEFRLFPNGANDDRIDAYSRSFRALNTGHVAKIVAPIVISASRPTPT